MTVSEVTDFIQTNFTHLGIAVKNETLRTIVLSLPADCVDLSSIIVELTAAFDCTIDLKSSPEGPELTVWVAKESQKFTEVQKLPQKKFLAFFTIVCIAIFILCSILFFFSRQFVYLDHNGY